MTKEQICHILEEYGISSECANDKNDRSWSDFIHYPTHRELILPYNAASEYFDFVRYMRAECIKSAVFFVPMTPEREYYKSYEHERGPVPLFSTEEEAKLSHEKYGMPSVEYCEEKTLMELLESLDKSTVFVINPATECEFVNLSYYTDCFVLAENIHEERIQKI